MELTVKFILCGDYYNFDDKPTGKHYEGYTVYAFEPVSSSLIKCHSNRKIDLEFGADFIVYAVPSGRYVKYEVA